MYYKPTLIQRAIIWTFIVIVIHELTYQYIVILAKAGIHIFYGLSLSGCLIQALGHDGELIHELLYRYRRAFKKGYLEKPCASQTPFIFVHGKA